MGDYDRGLGFWEVIYFLGCLFFIIFLNVDKGIGVKFIERNYSKGLDYLTKQYITTFLFQRLKRCRIP